MYTYQPYKHSKYKFQTNDGHVFETEEAAAAYCNNWNAYQAAMEPLADLPYELSLADYERACTINRVGTMSDVECDGYGVRYGEFSPPTYTPAQCVKMVLAKKRLAGIEVEREARRKAQPRPAPKPVEMVRCDCGHTVRRGEVMSASLGTSCFDCYDRMSG